MPKKADKKDPLVQFREMFQEVAKPEAASPTMKLQVSKLNSDELGDMISRYSTWREFVEDKLLTATAVLTEIQAEYDTAYNKAYVSSESKTVNDRKAEAEDDNVVQSIGKRLTEAQIYRDLLAGKLTSCSNAISTLSRELTRRGIEYHD